MSFRDRPDYSPLFDEMVGHFLRLPPETLVREVWHTHTKKQLASFIARTDFADRSREELGYLVPQVYNEHLRSSPYRIKWLPLEDRQEAINAFCSIYDRFNVYTTLNRYPLHYAHARLKVMLAEYKLWLARQNAHVQQMAVQIPALQERVDLAKETVPLQCHVDLAFDFDAGDEEEDGGLDGLIPSVLKLLDFCSLYEIPHQLFFSGGRGFHVVIPHTAFAQPLAEDNHLVNRRIAQLIQEETGDIHIDWAIYSNRRQFRLPNTRHQKTGLFKIALTRADLEAGRKHILQLAENPVTVPPLPEGHCEYLAGLYALGAARVRSQKRFVVDSSRLKCLPAARQSQPRVVFDDLGEADYVVVAGLNELVHPPCIREALTTGVPDPATANRNQVSVLLASYLKAIGRKLDESTDFLVRHALKVLAPFSHSSPQEIAGSTRTAVTTVFRHDRYQFNCFTARRLGFECNDTCELHAHTRETATSRRLHKVTETRVEAPRLEPERMEFSDVKVLRADMAQRVTDYISEARGGVHGEGRIVPLLVKSPAGSGKTTTVFNLLADLGLRTLWIATRLDLYDNIPQYLKPHWRRIEGRHGEATLPSGEVLPANCHYPDLAHRLRERRINVNQRLCRTCEHRGGCGYFLQFEDRVSSFFVQQPMYLHKVKDYAQGFDVVVFDEDVLGQFIEEVRIRERDVRQVADMLEELRTELESFQSYNEAAKLTSLICFLEGLASMLADTRVTQPITGTPLRQRMDEAHRTLYEGTGSLAIPITLDEAMKAIPRSLDSVVEQLHFDPRDPQAVIPLQFLNALLPVLRYELFVRDPKSNLSRLHFQSVRIPEKDGEDKGRRRFTNVLEVVSKADPPPLPVPTVILDATGKSEIYERLFGIRPRVYAPTMRLENRVAQVYSTSGSYESLRQAVFRKRMLDLLRKVVAEEPRTLVICKQALEPHIRPHLPPLADVAHFYGNRGSNAFKDFKRVVIFGMPGMTPDTVQRYAGALYYQDNLVTDAEFVVRRYVGNDVGVQVMVYKEPLIQAIAETAREDEVLQSIHRIRPGLDADKDIILFTNLVVPELPVTTLLSVREMLDRKPTKRKNLRRDHLVQLAQLQYANLDFVSPARTLWPLVGPESDQHIGIRKALVRSGCAPPVPLDSRYTRSRFYEAKEQVRRICDFERFEVVLISGSGRVAVEVWGRDERCLEAAQRFLKDHPLGNPEEAKDQSEEKNGGGASRFTVEENGILLNA